MKTGMVPQTDQAPRGCAPRPPPVLNGGLPCRLCAHSLRTRIQATSRCDAFLNWRRSCTFSAAPLLLLQMAAALRLLLAVATVEGLNLLGAEKLALEVSDRVSYFDEGCDGASEGACALF